MSLHHGAIAQTLYRSFNPFQNGSLDINASNPEFITAYAPQTPVEGMYLDKMGATTGWTTGPVVHTCKDFRLPTFALLCQDEVTAFAGNGDSGGPVFQFINQTSAAFSGIVWYTTGTGGTYYFSYVDRIASDMGSWVNYGPQ
ncbi:MAG: S1 family peptidase [Acidobacteriota bacterium]|nr:S1 family peptidase [Acidobacteriota bacterium]